MSQILDCLIEPKDFEIEEEYNPEFVNSSNQEDKQEYSIGIDLGTTNSCVAIWRNQNLEIIPDSFGNHTIPSIVAFGKKTKFIGREAKNQTEINPENCFYEVKRLIGRKYQDQTVQNDLEFLTYQIGEDDQGNVILKTHEIPTKPIITPEEISAQILVKLKNQAEAYLKQPIRKAVITVPAYFTDAQREATKDAAQIASLEVVRIINEPTAAALAYGLNKNSQDQDLNILVYDVGGGTTDVSILNICSGMFHVLASSGNTHLGGVDFDNRLVSFALSQFKRKNNINKLDNLSVLSMQKLRRSTEHTKKMLSQTSKDVIAVKDFYDGKNLFVPITRKDFEKVCRDLFIMCLKPVEDALKSAELNKKDIDEIILVGGATRTPLIRENIKKYFGGKEPNASVNPDEVVAMGAAIQAYILGNKSDPFSENVVVLDVIPLSLGVETIGGLMTNMIPRNSVIPINRTMKFTTDKDQVDSIKIKIFEGERKLTRDNFLIGEFILRGIEKAPRGLAKIEVSFNIDVNGIISVTAEDLINPDNKNAINISPNKGRLTQEEIERLINESLEMELKDKLERDKKQLFYQIDDMLSNILDNINSDDIHIKDKDKELITKDIGKVYDWLKEVNYNNRDHRDYSKILQKLTEKYGSLIMRS